MKLLTKTKINALVTFISMMVLGTTENGLIKMICLVSLVVEFCVFMVLFEEMSVADER